MNQLCGSPEQHSTLMATSSSSRGEHVINANLASPGNDAARTRITGLESVSSRLPSRRRFHGAALQSLLFQVMWPA
jgi:hypothetical protein